MKLADLSEEWERIPRRRPPSLRYAAQCRATLVRFTDFMRRENPRAEEIGQVTRDGARSFMEAETARGVTAKTWNDTLKLLRATFRHLMPTGMVNPFSGIPTRETETVFRKPFNPEELGAIVQAAAEDEFVRPILITAMCTAMRRGDCCQLKWAEVDLPRRFITVKTSKTGQTVSIPVFPMLHDELRGREVRGAYVFPEQAEMYRTNPDGITWRVRKVLADAGFKDDETGGATRGEVHKDRETGLRRASVRDFHSFRVTWVTLALTAGVPLELVQKVTGHRTTEIVLKHYFQPGREEFRKALQSAMPALLSNGSQSPRDEALSILATMSVDTWEADRDRLRELVGRIG